MAFIDYKTPLILPLPCLIWVCDAVETCKPVSGSYILAHSIIPTNKKKERKSYGNVLLKES